MEQMWEEEYDSMEEEFEAFLSEFRDFVEEALFGDGKDVWIDYTGPHTLTVKCKYENDVFYVELETENQRRLE